MKFPGLPAGYSDPVRLGCGAWGDVWRVHQDALGREVALKILPGTRDPEEARRQAEVDLPVVPAIYDAFHWHGKTFIAMEWLQGISLDDLLKAGPLPEEAVHYLAVALTSALMALHGRGTVHGDLKPANIVVLQDGGVRLLDLGFSQSLHASGRPRGTPAYLPPEALQAGSGPEARDLWALAVCLAECLKGRRPSGLDEALHGLPELQLPEMWRELLSRGLAADPSGRFPDAAAWKTFLASFPLVGHGRQILSELSDPLFRQSMSRTLLEAGEEHLRRLEPQTAFRLVSEALEWDSENGAALAMLGRIDLSRKRRRRWPWVLAAGAAVLAGIAGYLAGSRDRPPGMRRLALTMPLSPELLGSHRRREMPLDGPGFSEGNAPSLPAVLCLPPGADGRVIADGETKTVRKGMISVGAGWHTVQVWKGNRLQWQGRVRATAYQVVVLPVPERMK